MSGPRVLGLPLGAVLAALAAGAVLGSLAFLPRDASQSADPPSAGTPVDEQATAPGRAAGASASGGTGRSNAAATRPVPSEPERETGQVFASAGVAFEPVHQGKQFIGFRVIRSGTDPRFAEGDIIVAINGQPVEGSAAGGELLIAGLRNRDAAVELR